MATTDQNIMRNAYQKLSNMPLSFGLPVYSDSITDTDIEKQFGLDLKDTLRELKLKDTSSIESMSRTEMMLENRVVYYALKRFRNSASVFFKFSTATDGKSVDKQQIPKMLNEIIKEYDIEWKKWRSSGSDTSIGYGSLWMRESTVETNGDVN